MIVFEPDNSPEGADWIKNKIWDLPPYRSRDFFAAIGGEEYLEEFKTSRAYLSAVERGDIHDDEWVADYAEPEGEQE